MNQRRDSSDREAAPGQRSREDLLAPHTQVVADRDAYLGQGRHDVGRRISDDQVELFVSGDLASGLQQEFSRHDSSFIALHDVGTSASLRLLGSLAAAGGARIQRLSMRLQGHGVALAVLQFVEVPLADGTPVRVYATDVNADSHARVQLARVLLAYSRLGALMVGELPPHALSNQLALLHEAIERGPWPNRELLLVPLGSGTALAAQAAQLAGHSGVEVHVTPRAAKPKPVWSYIAGAWNRLQGATDARRGLPTDLASAVPPPRIPDSQAATRPMALDPLADGPPSDGRATGPRQAMPMPAAAAKPQHGDATDSMQPTQPMPMFMPSRAAPVKLSAPPAQPMPLPGGTQWQPYAERCAKIKGTVSCCVFDTHSAQPLAFAGGPPPADRLAQQGSTLLAAMNEASRALGLGPARAEAVIGTSGHHLLLVPVKGHPGVAVHLVLLASSGNATLARLQLERIEAPA